MKPEITVVIPTKDRENEVNKLLACLEKQSYPPKEVIIVDASDIKFPYKSEFLNIHHIPSTASSVCIQRNIGIQNSSTTYILLCDDDISFHQDYLLRLYKHLTNNPNVGAVTGLWHQLENNIWVSEYSPNSVLKSLYLYLFGLSVWGSLNNLKVSYYPRLLFYRITKVYNRLGNTTTKAGWPINTQFDRNPQNTTITSLGAALIRSELLNAYPYDEVLDPHGYGDNYEVCMNIKKNFDIHILTSEKVYHHRSESNRFSQEKASYRRVIALHYFLTQKKLKKVKIIYFYWSLIGLIMQSVLRGRKTLTKYYLTAFGLLFFGKNPYTIASLRGEKVVKLL